MAAVIHNEHAVYALVPVSRFLVEYELANGRPYSQLERLALRAIFDGQSTLAGLQETFQVHPRLVVDSIVTLVQAGWISLASGRDGEFALTAQGRNALETDEPPASYSVFRMRPANVVMERLVGLVIPENEVQFFSDRDVEPIRGISIEIREVIHDNRLDPAKVQRLLPRRPEDRVRWIGPIRMKSRFNHFFVFKIDLENKTVNAPGVPDRIVQALSDRILSEVASSPTVSAIKPSNLTIPGWREGRVKRGFIPAPDSIAVQPAYWDTFLASSQVIVGAAAHTRLLRGVLERARSRVFIASAFMGDSAINSLTEPLAAAMRRRVRSTRGNEMVEHSSGLSIDLLWGYESDGAARDRLKRLAYNAKQDDSPGTVRQNNSPSGSHAKLLVWNEDDGFHAVVGSYNWLSATPTDVDRPDSQLDISVSLTHPGLIAGLCRCAAALWNEAPTERGSSISDRWQNIAADLDQIDANSKGAVSNCRMRIVLDREHEISLAQVLAQAESRLLITSHRLGSAGVVRLLMGEDRPRSDGFKGVVAFGEQDVDSSELKRTEDTVERIPAAMKRYGGLHAKVAAGDTTAIVGSYNFLSADPFGTAKRSRELSIEIEGEPVPGMIDLIEDALGQPSS